MTKKCHYCARRSGADNFACFATLCENPSKSDPNSVLSRNHFSCICAYLHAIARNGVQSKFSAKNMCDVLPSARSSARTEMMNLISHFARRDVAPPPSTGIACCCKSRSFDLLSAESVPSSSASLPSENQPKSDRNSVLSKNISACTSMHLRAPARTNGQLFTTSKKHVRGFAVRTALCVD
jgi:hypothetical protein